MEKNTDTAEVSRDKVIIQTSVIGILANIFLAGFKAAVGVLSNSIAVILDAVNNLSDALSSVITIVGTKLAGKKPDKKHPLGYGRIEYLSAMFVSALVLYAGLTSLVESVKKIIHPEKPDYAAVSLVIIASAVLVKLILGRYVKKQGEKVNSGALVASGQDASFDAIISASVLASAVIYLTTGISLEAYVGVVISLVIIKAGIEMMSDTVNDILGQRADAKLTKRIKKLLAEEPEVRGAYDLILNNYGPDKEYASVHLELPDTMTVDEVDGLTRRVEEKVMKETGVILTGVGVYSYNTKDDESARIRNSVSKIATSYEHILQMHGFYVDLEKKMMRFDLVVAFADGAREEFEEACRKVQEAFPDYSIEIQSDIDASD